MSYPVRDLPDRMIALSILPPPPPWQPPAPFGLGAFVVTPGPSDHVHFAAHAHGYGAGHDPARLRGDIARLFTPETSTLTFVLDADPHGSPRALQDRHAEQIWEWIPHCGTQRNTHVTLTHDVLAHAASVGRVVIPGPSATPLARLHRITGEAQAIWLYWLFAGCHPRVRRRLLAGFQAWQVIERAGQTLVAHG